MSKQLTHLVATLLHHKFDLEFCWNEAGDTYNLHIILGNVEYYIDVNDHDRIKELSDDVENYWI